MRKKILSLCVIVFVASKIFAFGIFEDLSGNTQNNKTEKQTDLQVHSSDEQVNENISKFESVYKFLLENYVDELDADKLYKGAMNGMFDTLDDPYSEYFETDSSLGVSLQDTTTGEFGGIGVTITKPTKSTEEKPAYVEVMSAIPGTPGAKAGLRSGDYIIEVAGTPTDSITMNDVLAKLRGKIGTPVTIKVLRGELNFELTITRAKIKIPTVKYQKLGNGIGYIQLIEFNPNSAPQTIAAYDDLTNQGCKKFIFDLRNNPGGLLSAANDLASFFLEKGDIVSTDGRMENSVVCYKVDRNRRHIPTDIPIVTLIDGGSASASEILAGALKDHKRSVLVGTTTYGKGVVQLIYDINHNEAFKFTSSRYYTPSGANIHGKGIPPDYEVSYPEVLESETAEFERLYASKVLDNFAKSKQNITNAEIIAYAKQLQRSYKIRLVVLELALKSRVDSYKNDIDVDPEFDPQLRKALELLTNNDVNKLAGNTKTVLQLQEENESKNKK